MNVSQEPGYARRFRERMLGEALVEQERRKKIRRKCLLMIVGWIVYSLFVGFASKYFDLSHEKVFLLPGIVVGTFGIIGFVMHLDDPANLQKYQRPTDP